MTTETMSWSVLASHMDSSIPMILPMGGTRGVLIGFNPSDSRLFLRLPCDPNEILPPTRLTGIQLRQLVDASGPVLEVETRVQSLFPEFHRLLARITEVYEDEGLTAVGAFTSALNRWGALLAARSVLSADQQLGLLGELLFLTALVRARGPGAVTSWTGRSTVVSDRHDFRLKGLDIEVKTTLRTRRVHTIHGLDQLRPSHDHELYVLSIRLQNAGNGEGVSLTESVAIIRQMLKPDAHLTREFEAKLQAAQYHDDDAEHYSTRITFADLPRLVPVDAACPRITPDSLVATTHLGRLSEVTYSVDLEGLGEAQGSNEFCGVLGELALEVR